MQARNYPAPSDNVHPTENTNSDCAERSGYETGMSKYGQR